MNNAQKEGIPIYKSHSPTDNVFSESFYGQLHKEQKEKMSHAKKKERLIETISQRIHAKHQDVINYQRVRQFTEHAIAGKEKIDPQDLNKIEAKI